MRSQTGETRIKTNFLENQAKEVSHKKMSKGPLIALGIVFLAGVSFGGYKVVEFLMNYETIAMMKNIDLILDSPTTKDGQATVDVIVRNNNPFPVKDFAFKFTVDGVTGGKVAGGIAKIDNLVPAVDERKFASVPLGAISGDPAHMHVDLSAAVIADKSKLPGDIQQRITDSILLKEQDSVAAFEQLDKELPENPVILSSLGIAYEECSLKDKAKQSFEKAIAAAEAEADKAGRDAASAATLSTAAAVPGNAPVGSSLPLGTKSALENAHYHLGLLLRDSDKKKAKAEFEAAAALNPSDPNVQSELEKLK